MPIVLSSRDYGIVFQRVDEGERLDHVPPHVYTLALIGNPMEGMELALMKDRKTFNTPPRLYGSNSEYLNMIVDDWRESDNATGVMLFGKKGCGKTVLAEVIGNKILTHDVPVFLINSKIPTGMIKQTLAACPTGAMVLFDEFEKIYDEDDQKELLVLFSDSDLKKVLFIMTVNDPEEINDFLINRPGRIKYWIHYEGIEDSVVRELMEEMKVPKVLHSGIREWARAQGDDASFDIMKFVCKEALKCASWAQLVKRIKVLNVPGMYHHEYRLVSAHIDSREYYREHVKFEMTGERNFSINVKCQETGIDLYEEFDIQCGGAGEYDRTVRLPGDIILDVHRSDRRYHDTEDLVTIGLSAKPVPKEVAQEPLGKNQLQHQLNPKGSSAESSMSQIDKSDWIVSLPDTVGLSAEHNESGKAGTEAWRFTSKILEDRHSGKAERLASNGSMAALGHYRESIVDSAESIAGIGQDFDGDSAFSISLGKLGSLPFGSMIRPSSLSMLSSKHTSAVNKKDPKGNARNEGKPRKGF